MRWKKPAWSVHGGSCTAGNRPVLFVVQSIAGFRISIAITIAVENFTGSIVIRFFLCERIVFFPEKPGRITIAGHPVDDPDI